MVIDPGKLARIVTCFRLVAAFCFIPIGIGIDNV